MSYRIDISDDAEKVIKKWKKSNPLAFKKLYKLLPELEQHPRSGKGHPEPLKGGKDVTWSRHITANDRIIYDIYDDVITVLVVEVEGHYYDK
ncbi:MAG: Txe/YoeB family addiction module toxin [Bacteroides sp.]|nr:Txe/YoeB family addiction module toxin [Bacteroides sp.]